MRNISANNRQKVLKLCTCMAMKKVYSTVHSTLWSWRSLGFRSLPLVKQNSFISSLSITTFTTVHRFKDSYTRRYCISAVLIILFFKKEIEIKILFVQLKDSSFPAVSSATTYCTQWCVLSSLAYMCKVSTLSTCYLQRYSSFCEFYLVPVSK